MYSCIRFNQKYFCSIKNTVYLQRNVEDDGSTKRIHILRILCQRPRSLRQIYLKSASDPSPACGFLFFYIFHKQFNN